MTHAAWSEVPWLWVAATVAAQLLIIWLVGGLASWAVGFAVRRRTLLGAADREPRAARVVLSGGPYPLVVGEDGRLMGLLTRPPLDANLVRLVLDNFEKVASDEDILEVAPLLALKLPASLALQRLNAVTVLVTRANAARDRIYVGRAIEQLWLIAQSEKIAADVREEASRGRKAVQERISVAGESAGALTLVLRELRRRCARFGQRVFGPRPAPHHVLLRQVIEQLVENR